jgi:hypothetical protein
MGGGNAQKSAVARERNAAKAKALAGGKYVFNTRLIVSRFKNSSGMIESSGWKCRAFSACNLCTCSFPAQVVSFLIYSENRITFN